MLRPFEERTGGLDREGYGDPKILPMLFQRGIKDFIFNRIATFLFF
jgi:hypothetical protein